MSIVALISTLEERGVDAETILAAVKSVAGMTEVPARSSQAERQARYRARKAGKEACDVTRDVTRDASPSSPSSGSLSPAPPILPNLPHLPLQKEPLKGFQKGSPKAGKPDASESLIAEDGVDPQTLVDWQAVRKAKRAGPITPTVVAGLRAEAAKAGLSVAAAVTMAAQSGWQGFRAEWVERATGPPQGPRRTIGGGLEAIAEFQRRLKEAKDERGRGDIDSPVAGRLASGGGTHHAGIGSAVHRGGGESPELF